MKAGRQILALLLLSCAALAAQEPKPPESPKPAETPKPAEPPKPQRAWSDKGILNFVSVGGNAKSQSFGFTNEYKYNWVQSTFDFKAGGVKVATTTFNRSAYGPDLNTVTLVETETTATTAENYFANLRFDRKLSDSFFWFIAGGWDRNVPSGIADRTMGNAGLGYWWVKEDRTKFRTDLGLGYTTIRPVLLTPGFEQNFATWSFGASLEKKFMETSSFTSNLQLTDSLRHTQDYLAVWQNALTVKMNAHFALQVGYTLTYKNQPASIGVDVVQTPVATPPVILGQVAVPLKKTDTMFTTGLVFTF